MVVTPEQVRPQIRAMQAADLSEIAAIEQTAFPDPWPPRSFADCLQLGYTCRVLEQGGIIQGYAIMSLEGTVAHILNLCVRAEFRRRGLARQLLQHLLELGRAYRARSVFLEVRHSNRPAIRLYESLGFARVGIRRGYYPGPEGNEDALVMALHP